MHEQDPSPGLRIQLLGGFRVWVGPWLIDETGWRLRKASALVKLLALDESHRLPRERAMDLLWPEFDPLAADNNLRQTLHVARRVLEPRPSATAHYLQVREDMLVLCADVRLWIDVEAFERTADQACRLSDATAYQRALAIYSGMLLPDDPSEDWAVLRREALHETYLGLLGELARIHERDGDLDGATEALRRLVESDPSCEEAHVSLMRLHALAGERHLALRQYRQLREGLRRELDAEPEPTSERLYREILTGRFPPGDSPVHSRHSLPATLSTFIGREAETAEVNGLVGSTRLLTRSRTPTRRRPIPFRNGDSGPGL